MAQDDISSRQSSMDAAYCRLGQTSRLQAQLCKLRLVVGPLQPLVAHAHLFLGASTHPFATSSFSSAVGPKLISN